ncbi:N-acetylglucosamine kinase [Namhaeicola litoreus]|uniref:N-acetylglucosamine kinase n=1 Tax=Namhaeicola litoreus TaxID=1052145 RepID=A0ABW3Y357_9FLAO
MLLVADSGSTKTSWICLDNKGNQVFKSETKGLNPAVFPKQTLHDRVMSDKDLSEYKDKITNVFFYGAGCGTKTAVKYLEDVFQLIFTNANIDIKEDTLAAVKALQSEDPAIVCILGTGSNCSFFDGKETHQKIISLGYIVMDDASGNYYGRQLLRDYYFHKMPKDLAKMFADAYDLSPDIIKEHLYKYENPNTYLADIGRFIIENKKSEYAQRVIKTGLRTFVENQILQFDESKVIPVSFVGSIAHYLKEEVEEVLKEYNLILGKIVRHPINSVAEYHLKNL